MTVCLPCARGFHEECSGALTLGKCCCVTVPEDKAKIIAEVVDSWGVVSEFNLDEEKRPVGRPRKNDDEIGTSAGRKRAAEEYKIHRDKPCEWRWLANCGGGKHPIIGCLDGKQVNRHHGPIKNTSNNAEINVHLICSPCHNLWHSKNDFDYNEEDNRELPHKPRPMTPEEMLGSR